MPEPSGNLLQLAPHVLEARRCLADSWGRWASGFWTGESPWSIARKIMEFRDELLRMAVGEATRMENVPVGRLQGEIAIVAHGGYGRGDLAPCSDVDLLFLCSRGSQEAYRGVISRVMRDLTDAGLDARHTVLTPWAACSLACRDPQVYTSLAESRLLWGSQALFRRFWQWFRWCSRLLWPRLRKTILEARAEERRRFGETIYLNEPHVKRSEGALRDLHMIRWLSTVALGSRDFRSLQARGWISDHDLAALQEAWTFLLRVRQAIHFHVGHPTDWLNRSEQMFLAERFGYRGSDGLLPVEVLMRDYFRHTDTISRMGRLVIERTRPFQTFTQRWHRTWGRQLDRKWILSGGRLLPSAKGWQELETGLHGVLEFALVACRYRCRIDELTWDRIRSRYAGRTEIPSARARQLFWQLLEDTSILGELLSQLHEAGILQYFVPGLDRAQGLLQFNQYHKYTVDKHCLEAVRWSLQLAESDALLGKVYRSLPRKAVLHLALLMHDLGKGFEEDHRQVGARLAKKASEFLGLSPQDAEDLVFLVGEHLLMNHLAFRRDIHDKQLLVQFAVTVGSPERLGMLFVLTAADLAAVGPNHWTSWKADVLAELYQRAMQHLVGDVLTFTHEKLLQEQRQAVARWLGPLADQPWFARQITSLPGTYLSSTPASRIAEDLRLLSRLDCKDIHVEANWNPQRQTITVFLATNEAIGPGIFHKLAGAISSQGWEILAADIHTLVDGWVIDRVEARDPDFPGKPPPERVQGVLNKIRESVSNPAPVEFTFRQSWFMRPSARPTAAFTQTRVQISNSISPQFTVIDVFAADRPGLLFTIAKTLYQLGLSVARARIGTYLDQVVDVFYVTDAAGRKITDEKRLEEIQSRVLAAVESVPLG
jgi:[protein-PII] uridylyltransferase